MPALPEQADASVVQSEVNRDNRNQKETVRESLFNALQGESSRFKPAFRPVQCQSASRTVRYESDLSTEYNMK